MGVPGNWVRGEAYDDVGSSAFVSLYNCNGDAVTPAPDDRLTIYDLTISSPNAGRIILTYDDAAAGKQLWAVTSGSSGGVTGPPGMAMTVNFVQGLVCPKNVALYVVSDSGGIVSLSLTGSITKG